MTMSSMLANKPNRYQNSAVKEALFGQGFSPGLYDQVHIFARLGKAGIAAALFLAMVTTPGWSKDKTGDIPADIHPMAGFVDVIIPTLARDPRPPESKHGHARPDLAALVE